MEHIYVIVFFFHYIFFLVSFIHSYYLVGCAMIVNGQEAYKEIDCYMMNSSFSELASINDCVQLHTNRILVILKHLKQSYTFISFILYVRTKNGVDSYIML